MLKSYKMLKNSKKQQHNVFIFKNEKQIDYKFQLLDS